MRARDIIRTEYGKSRNFMTEHVMQIGSIKRGRIAYELSWGYGFDNDYVVGVSVASCNKAGSTTREYDMSKSFCGAAWGTVVQQAREYIEELKEA